MVGPHPKTLFLMCIAAVLGTAGCGPEANPGPAPDNEVVEPTAPETDADLVEAVLDLLDSEDVDPDAVADVYHDTCWQCHFYGGASSPLGSEKSAVGAVAKGREYVVERIVYGAPVTDESPGMPSFSSLSVDDLAGIVAMLEREAEAMGQ